MKNFTLENTAGYSQSQLDYHNLQFPVWAENAGFDLDDEDHLKSASDQYFNEVMIYE